MAQKDSSVSLKDWLEAPWFKLAVRLFAIVGGAAIPAVGALVIATLVRIGTVETSMASIAEDQVKVRASLTSQESISSAFRGEVRTEIKDVQDGIGDLREDVATALGILEGMKSSREARLVPPGPLASDGFRFPALQR